MVTRATWFGNIIKMNVLPMFLYVFQALPIHIPSAYFRQVNALFTKFVWTNKRPRIRRRLLTLPKMFGGLTIPDIQKYHQAAHFTRVIDWCRHSDQKLWTHLEQQFSTIPFHRAPWCFRALPSILKAHPIIGPTLMVCQTLCKNLAITTTKSPLYPVLGNPDFLSGLRGGPFHSLLDSGYFQVSHFLNSDSWPSIPDLMQLDGRFALDFWRTLQLHHFLWTLGSPTEYRKTPTPFESHCMAEGTLCRTLSTMYSILISPTEEF